MNKRENKIGKQVEGGIKRDEKVRIIVRVIFRRVLKFTLWAIVYFEIARLIVFVEAVLKINPGEVSFYVGFVLGASIYIIYAGTRKRMDDKKSKQYRLN